MNSGACTELVVGEPELITPDEEHLYLETFRSLLPEVTGAFVIAGSRLKGFSDRIIPAMVREIKERGLLLFADYREGDLLSSFSGPGAGPDYVKINGEEFLKTFPCEDLERGLTEQSLRLGCRFIISRGASSTLAAEEGRIIEIPSKTVKAVNPIGCGDAMTAGLAAGILEGLSLEDAVKKGRDFAARNAVSLRTGWILSDDYLNL
jgi:fructose-1-phosphate kinase PfkB-like protein